MAAKMPQDKSIKVIVAGLPRTATMSLKAALEQLGYGPCHHLLEPTFQIDRIRRSAETLMTEDKQLRQARFKNLYQGYEVALDLPGSACVDDLIQIYPNAKVILTKRKNAALWLASVEGLGINNTSIWFQLICFWVPGVISSAKMSGAWLKRHRQRIGRNEPLCENTYTEHNEWIRSIVSKDLLLEFEPSMGWKPLCEFLGKDVPETEFPRRNDRNYLKNGMRAAVVAGLILWVAVTLFLISGMMIFHSY